MLEQRFLTCWWPSGLLNCCAIVQPQIKQRLESDFSVCTQLVRAKCGKWHVACSTLPVVCVIVRQIYSKYTFYSQHNCFNVIRNWLCAWTLLAKVRLLLPLWSWGSTCTCMCVCVSIYLLHRCTYVCMCVFWA